MAKEAASPAYLMYPSDILASGRVAALRPLEELWYRRALDLGWEHEGMPADAAEFAGWVGRGCTVAAAEKIIEKFYKPHKKDTSKVVNPRQEKERTNLAKNRKKKSDGGRKGMENRWKRDKQKTSGDNIVITKPITNDNISIPISIPKDLRKEGEGETPPLALPPTDLKFEDSAFEHPAVVVYQERFQVKVRTNFAKAVADRVKDLGVWNALISDKIAWADEPLEKRQNVAKWILSAYDERVEEKRSGNGVRGKGFPQGVVQAQPYNEMDFQKRLGEQKPK